MASPARRSAPGRASHGAWAPGVAGLGCKGLQAGGAVRCAPIMEKRGTPLTRHSAVGEARQCALAM
eukprot:scaffold28386_cov54-Phaeocystis_antarctica.AAC.1